MNTPSENSNSPMRYRSPQNGGLMLALIASLTGLWLIQFHFVSLFGLLVTAFAMTIAFWGRKIWPIYAVVGIVLLFQFFNVTNRPRQDLAKLFLQDLLFPFVFIAFLGASFRFFEIYRVANAFYPKELAAKNQSESKWYFPSLLSGRWWMIPIAIFLAFFLLALFPYDYSTRYEYWIQPRPARVIFLLGCLFLMWFVGRSLVLLASRWTIRPDQADMVCRSHFASEHWVEHAGIERRLAKLDIKNRKESN